MTVLHVPTFWRKAQSDYHLAKPPEDMSGYDEYMVDMAPANDRELSDVVIVKARTNIEAVYEAFLTRNMPNEWIVLEVERG